MTEDQLTKLREEETAALDMERLARLAVEDAIKRFRDAVDRRLQVQLQLAVSVDRAGILHDEIRGNKATWSGGPHSATNVMEAIVRESAIDYLRRV